MKTERTAAGTPSNNGFGRSWQFGLALLFAVIAAACGGEESVDSAASAIDEAAEDIASSEGVDRDDSVDPDPEEFCRALRGLDEAFDATIGSEEPLPLDALEEAEETLRLIPSEAPHDVVDFIDVHVMALVIDSESQEFEANFERLLEIDNDVLQTYIARTCVGFEVRQGGQLLASTLTLMVADAFESAGSNAEDSGASQAASAETTTTTTEAPPVPSVENLLLTGDGSLTANYERISFEVEQAISTNGEIDGFLQGDEVPAGDANYLVIDLFAEATSDAQNSFSSNDLLLIDPDGRATPAFGTFTSAGVSELGIDIASRSSVETRVVFETNELLTTVDGYVLAIDRDDRVPAQIDLAGANVSEYPLALETGITASMESTNLSPDCDADIWSTTITEAVVVLEDGSSVRVTRTPRNTRLVRFTVEALNETVIDETDLEDLFCEAGSGQSSRLNFRLMADGRPLAAAITIESANRHLPGELGIFNLTYEVSADATDLVLVGTRDEDVLGTWTLDAPPVPGE